MKSLKGVSVLGLVSAPDHSSSGTRGGKMRSSRCQAGSAWRPPLSSAESISLSAADGKICPDIGHLLSLCLLIHGDIQQMGADKNRKSAGMDSTYIGMRLSLTAGQFSVCRLS